MYHKCASFKSAGLAFLIIALWLCQGLTNLSAQNAFDEKANFVHSYYDFALEAVKNTNGFTPPVVARTWAYVGLSLYETTVPFMSGYSTLQGKLQGNLAIPNLPSTSNVDCTIAANQALYRTLDSLMSNLSKENREALKALYKSQKSEFCKGKSAEICDKSELFGETVALAVLAYAKSDGGYNAELKNYEPSFTIRKGVGLWSPTVSQQPLLPYWGDNRTFSERNKGHDLIQAPVPFNTKKMTPFYNEALKVHDAVANISENHRNTVNYWADGKGTSTPSGHSIAILKSILIQENANLGDAALAYAQLGLALSDAFVACWNTKYNYMAMRPEEFIRTNIEPEWHPVIPTPPFPEYPSGHATQAGAFEFIMSSIFGDAYLFTDDCHKDRYGTRQYSSFSACAREIADSRFYAGLHYEFSNTEGRVLGKSVAKNVLALFNKAGLQLQKAQALPLAIGDFEKKGILLKNTKGVAKTEVTTLSGSVLKTVLGETKYITPDEPLPQRCLVRFWDESNNLIAQNIAEMAPNNGKPNPNSLKHHPKIEIPNH